MRNSLVCVEEGEFICKEFYGTQRIKEKIKPDDSEKNNIGAWRDRRVEMDVTLLQRNR